jgi:hypothetical protein
MTKSKKSVKASKAATTAPHLFMHRCQSGNVIFARLSIPRPGHKSQWDASWHWKASEADLSEQEQWLASVAQTASAIAGRGLNLRFEDQRGVRIEFPADMEAAA